MMNRNEEPVLCRSDSRGHELRPLRIAVALLRSGLRERIWGDVPQTPRAWAAPPRPLLPDWRDSWRRGLVPGSLLLDVWEGVA
jgi:hypothetical protein